MSGVWVVKSVGFNGGRSQQYFQFHWDFHNSKAGAFDNSYSGSFWSIECWNIIIRYDDRCIASYCIFLPRDTYIQSKLSRIKINFATQDMNQDVYYKDLFTIVCMIILPFLLPMKLFYDNCGAANESKAIVWDPDPARHV